MEFTAKDMHDAYNAAHAEPGKPPLVGMLSDWEQVNKYSKELYAKMAEYLNKIKDQSQSEKQN